MAENQFSNFDHVLVGITKESTTSGAWGAAGSKHVYRYPLLTMVDSIKPDKNANTKIRKWMGAGRDPNTVWSGPQTFSIKVEGSYVFDTNFGTTPHTFNNTNGESYDSTTEHGFANLVSMLGCAMGTITGTTYGDQCVLRDTLDSFTMEWGLDSQMKDQVLSGHVPANEYYNRGTPEYLTAVGCRINTYEWKLNKDGEAKVTMDILCKDIGYSTTPQDLGGLNNLDDIYLPNYRPIDMWDGHPSSTPIIITLGDSSTYTEKVGAGPEVEEISFKINNNLDPRHSLGRSKNISSLNVKGREITCSMNIIKRATYLKDVWNETFEPDREQDFYHSQTHLDSIQLLFYHQDMKTPYGAGPPIQNFPMMFAKFNNLIPIDFSDNSGDNDDEQVVENFTYRCFRTGDARFLHTGHTASLEPMQARTIGTTTFSSFVSNPGYP